MGQMEKDLINCQNKDDDDDDDNRDDANSPWDCAWLLLTARAHPSPFPGCSTEVDCF